MRILNHLRKDWFRHGFETLAVVVGILVAIALENWNDTRRVNEIERDHLEQFREDHVPMSYKVHPERIEPISISA